MLIVQRKVGERIVIGGGIEIVVTEVSARGVRLGVTAPRGVLVLRGEVHDAIAAANTESATPTPGEPGASPPRAPPKSSEDP
jgi:carbon storage regulator